MMQHKSKVSAILLILVSIMVSCTWQSNALPEESGQPPIETFYILFETHELDTFFNVTKEFSKEQNFTYDLTNYGEQNSLYLVYLSRSDYKITLTKTSTTQSDQVEFAINFYTKELTEKDIDLDVVKNLSTSLQNFLLSIPTIKISDTQTY